MCWYNSSCTKSETGTFAKGTGKSSEFLKDNRRRLLKIRWDDCRVEIDGDVGDVILEEKRMKKSRKNAEGVFC